MGVIDTSAFDDWRQGDVLTVASALIVALAKDSSEEVRVAVISQSCDIVRGEWISVVPVASLDSSKAGLARRGSMPQFAHLPELGQEIFADLSFVTSLRRSELADRPRMAGVDPSNWDDVRKLSRAIGRRFSRFAFPDPVVPWFDPLRPYFERRHEKDTSVGRVLRAIRELRVQTDDWHTPGAEVTLHVIVKRAEIPEPDDGAISDDVRTLMDQEPTSLESVCDLLRPSEGVVRGGPDGVMLWHLVGRALAQMCVIDASKVSIPGAEYAVSRVECEVVSESEFTLWQFRHSETLDLDHLSPPDVGL